MTTTVLVEMDEDDFHFISTYDPERERSASRRDLVTVIEHIQAVLMEGVHLDG